MGCRRRNRRARQTTPPGPSLPAARESPYRAKVPPPGPLWVGRRPVAAAPPALAPRRIAARAEPPPVGGRRGREPPALRPTGPQSPAPYAHSRACGRVRRGGSRSACLGPPPRGPLRGAPPERRQPVPCCWPGGVPVPPPSWRATGPHSPAARARPPSLAPGPSVAAAGAGPLRVPPPRVPPWAAPAAPGLFGPGGGASGAPLGAGRGRRQSRRPPSFSRPAFFSPGLRPCAPLRGLPSVPGLLPLPPARSVAAASPPCPLPSPAPAGGRGRREASPLRACGPARPLRGLALGPAQPPARRFSFSRPRQGQAPAGRCAALTSGGASSPRRSA